MKTGLFRRCVIGAVVLLPIVGAGGIAMTAGVSGAYGTGFTSITFTSSGAGSTVNFGNYAVNFTALDPNANCWE